MTQAKKHMQMQPTNLLTGMRRFGAYLAFWFVDGIDGLNVKEAVP